MYDPIASRYATALYEQLSDRSLMEEVLGQLSALAALMEAEPDLTQLLLNPDVDLPDKLKVCESIWLGQVREDVHDFLRMVLSRGRAEWLMQSIEAFRDLVDGAYGRRRVTVRSARPLPPLVKTRLVQRLEQREGCQVLLTEETEPALIGGLQVQVAHRLIDGTLQTQLAELRHRLKQVRVA